MKNVIFFFVFVRICNLKNTLTLFSWKINQNEQIELYSFSLLLFLLYFTGLKVKCCRIYSVWVSVIRAEAVDRLLHYQTTLQDFKLVGSAKRLSGISYGEKLIKIERCHLKITLRLKT